MTEVLQKGFLGRDYADFQTITQMFLVGIESVKSVFESA